jgi:hypothetical protein
LRDAQYEYIGSYKSAFEAQSAAMKLESEDIPAVVVSEGRYAGLAGGYRVRVEQEDAERAREMLFSGSGEIDMDEYVDPDDRSYTRCPGCNSVNVSARPLSGTQATMSILTLGIALYFLPRDWTCKKCGHAWRR